MKNLFEKSIFILLTALAVACTDETMVDDVPTSDEEFNIEGFCDGYSVAFDVLLDRMGGDTYTRAGEIEDPDDARIQEWENHLDPEEFRVLFFDSKDRFLFESRSRWFTQIASENGGRRWRVGIPIFQYLSDGYDPNISDRQDWSMDDAYNWDRIIEIMKSESFKIAILANRPSELRIPTISDWDSGVKVVNFGKNGPFWGPENSVASYDDPDHEGAIKKVFDLHHCQYDPIYHSKNKAAGGTGCYDFVMENSGEKLADGTIVDVPHMGAVSSWLNPRRTRRVPNSLGNDGRDYFFYRLPIEDRIQGIIENDYDKILVNPNADPPQYRYDKLQKNNNDVKAEDQYIPMYGIQKFKPLKTWIKGTTYNLSQQTGSQTGEYDYKNISLLRSVVKLELRIPMYEMVGNSLKKVDVNNDWAEIYGNNFMARCEPMDNWTPTNEIWSENHTGDCEWLRIKEYGLYANDESGDNVYKRRLSWFFGAWKDETTGWNFMADNKSLKDIIPLSPDYPRIFNPITQRLTCSFISDCYLPIIPEFDGYDDDGNKKPKVSTKNYHRWIVYCGEKNINDPNTLNLLTSAGIINFFRIEVTRKDQSDRPYTRIYNLPITDYSQSQNPIKNFMVVQNADIQPNGGSYPEEMSNTKSTFTDNYCYQVKQQSNHDLYPYPLLRNHHYRVTVGFGDGDDINVNVENGERRDVTGIEFN